MAHQAWYSLCFVEPSNLLIKELGRKGPSLHCDHDNMTGNTSAEFRHNNLHFGISLQGIVERTFYGLKTTKGFLIHFYSSCYLTSCQPCIFATTMKKATNINITFLAFYISIFVNQNLLQPNISLASTLKLIWTTILCLTFTWSYVLHSVLDHYSIVLVARTNVTITHQPVCSTVANKIKHK